MESSRVTVCRKVDYIGIWTGVLSEFAQLVMMNPLKVHMIDMAKTILQEDVRMTKNNRNNKYKKV